MKILFCQLFVATLLMILVSVDIRAQIIDSSQQANNQLIYQQYLKKSNNQNVAGKIMVISGGACLSTALILVAASFDGLLDPNAPERKHGDAGSVFAIGGLALVVASVPFFYSAKVNKKKARLYLKNETLILHGNKVTPMLAALGLKLKL